MSDDRPPLTREGARTIALESALHPDRLIAYPHHGFENDPAGGGFAFLDGVDRLITVGRQGIGCWLVEPDDLVVSGRLVGEGLPSPRQILDEQVALSRHRNRRLDDADLPPWQAAAVVAYRAGSLGVGDLPIERRPGVQSVADIDYADYILARLRNVGALDPLRVLAADDFLMSPPVARARGASRYTHPCPVCGAPTMHQDRYPASICHACSDRAVDRGGRRIRGANDSPSGGFTAYHVTDDHSWDDVCREVTVDHRCWVDGRICSIGEARFGGVVIQVLPGEPLS